ncbi:MAG: M23 family metallopeptidase [Sphingomonadales bacterium]|nr:M23 family metallopeptidase [Sphingomonadales bacterium]
MRKIGLVITCCTLFLGTGAQLPRYPQGYFINPMSVPMELTANFGELRNNHWHMGLDIRTNARENLPVRAAAAGHISFIGVRPLSFGRFIIIEHPNGLSTLYAHLNDFAPAIEQYVTRQQYAQESWAVELKLTPDQFPIRQGQLIAFSGNTGGSAGPHLHFEIIDTKSSKRLNPLLFGFPLPDRVPPVVKSLVFYDRSRSMSNQRPQAIPLKKTALGYEPVSGKPIKTSWHQLGFAIQAYDQVSGSTNPNGIYAASVSVDEKRIAGFVIDSIDYDQTGYINAHIDYAHKQKGGALYQHLSPLPGEASGIYKNFADNGIVHLNDTALHKVLIRIEDAYGNRSLIQFQIQSDVLPLPAVALPIKKTDPLSLFITPTQPFSFKRQDVELMVPAGAVYDSVPLAYAVDAGALLPPALTQRHRFNSTEWPLHSDVQVKLRAAVPLEANLQKKLLMQRSWGAIKKIKPAVWQQGWISASFDDFGYFQAYLDTTPPEIRLPGKGDTIDCSASLALVITPTDNFGVIRSFRAELNGQWLRFTNDKGRSWVYRFDERCPYGTHQLSITVQDAVGNESTRNWTIKRAPYRPPVKKKRAGSSKKR